MNVRSVEKSLDSNLIWEYTKGSIMEKNLLCANSLTVTKGSIKKAT